jgi:NitT/TauT family transport system substrate-binding protein
MLKKRTTVLLIFSTLFFSGCANDSVEKLKISANAWIGYSPLFYAREMGWLDEAGVNLVHVVSLGESMKLYQVGNVEAFTGTQYEYSESRKKQPALIPLILFDKSYGGDMIMSNRSIEQLLSTTDTIDVYLEVDSVNKILISDFLKTEQLENKSFNYINRDQADISTLLSTEQTSATIIVTYVPYNSTLEKQGFRELSNTRDNNNLLVLDALYTTFSSYKQHRNTYMQLKQLTDKAIAAANKDPQDFFKVVNPYLGFSSFEEFEAALAEIIWLNHPDEELLHQIEMSGFPITDLLH